MTPEKTADLRKRIGELLEVHGLPAGDERINLEGCLADIMTEIDIALKPEVQAT